MISTWKEAVERMLVEEDLSREEEEIISRIKSQGYLEPKEARVIKRYFNSRGIKLGCSTEATEGGEFRDPDEIPLIIPIKVPEREPERVPIPVRRRR